MTIRAFKGTTLPKHIDGQPGCQIVDSASQSNNTAGALLGFAAADALAPVGDDVAALAEDALGKMGVSATNCRQVYAWRIFGAQAFQQYKDVGHTIPYASCSMFMLCGRTQRCAGDTINIDVGMHFAQAGNDGGGTSNYPIYPTPGDVSTTLAITIGAQPWGLIYTDGYMNVYMVMVLLSAPYDTAPGYGIHAEPSVGSPQIPAYFPRSLANVSTGPYPWSDAVALAAVDNPNCNGWDTGRDGAASPMGIQIRGRMFDDNEYITSDCMQSFVQWDSVPSSITCDDLSTITVHKDNCGINNQVYTYDNVGYYYPDDTPAGNAPYDLELVSAPGTGAQLTYDPLVSVAASPTAYNITNVQITFPGVWRLRSHANWWMAHETGPAGWSYSPEITVAHGACVGPALDNIVDVVSGAPIPSFRVWLVDQFDNVCADLDDTITLTMDSSVADWGIDPPVLSGTLVKTTSGGLATFDDISVHGLGKFERLYPVGTTYGTNSYRQFHICCILAFDLSGLPGVIHAGDTITIVVKLVDFAGATLVPDYTESNKSVLEDGPLAGGFTGNGDTTPVAGVASWTGSFPAAGTWNLHTRLHTTVYRTLGGIGYDSADIVVVP